MKKFPTWIWLIKFAFYGGIACYDYWIGSKYMLGWLLLALLMLAFYIVDEIKQKN